jgi:4-hydroxy-tetrahydrodipicolinate reductase
MENKLPNIALIGYGSMGKEIEQSALANGFVITEVFDIDKPISSGGSYQFDVAIDFSLPSAVLENVKTIAKLKKNIVIGTTGWNDLQGEIFKIVTDNNIGLVYGSNFSVGMQIFFKLTALAAQLLNNKDDFDIMLHELHHKRKKDSPSGTALSLANIILENNSNKKSINTETSHGSINPNDLHVTSTRGGEITGSHTIYIDSISDSIELNHTAKNRKGFASGAIKAAEWIYGKSGVYNFSDIIQNL